MVRLSPITYRRSFSHNPLVRISTGSRIRQIALGIFCGVFAIQVAAQSLPLKAAAPDLIETGVPSFVVLGPEALGLTAAPVDLRQLPDGRLLAVGLHELALGDGVRWEVFRQAEGDQPVDTLSVEIDQDGQIYAGVPGGFARIDFGQNGRWHYTLVASFPADVNRNTPAQLNTASVGNEWFWWWDSGLVFSWRPGTAARLVGKTNSPERVFLLGDKIHLSDGSDGDLFRFEEGYFRSITTPSQNRIDQTITCQVPLGDGRDLVGTITNGVHIATGTTLQPLKAGSLLTSGHRINDLCATDGGFFAAAVDNAGIVFFDRNGRTVQVLDRATDHRLARVKRLLTTPGGVVWALLNEGIVRIGFPDRVSNIEPLVSTGLAFAQPYRHKGRLWVLGDGRAQRGVYDEGNRLVRFDVDSPPGFLSFMVELDDSLFASGSQGLYLRNAQDGWTCVAPTPHSIFLLEKPVAPDRWLYVAENEVGWLRRTEGKFSLEGFPVPGLGTVFGGLLDGHGVLWTEMGAGKVARIAPTMPRPTVETFGLAEGVPDHWVQVFKIDDEVRINVPLQMKILDTLSGHFIPDAELLRRQPELVGAIGRPMRDSQNRLWVTNRGRVHIYAQRGTVTEETPEVIPEGLLPTHFNAQEDGVVWMHQRMRLARYDPAMPRAQPVPLHALITRVQFPTSNREIFRVGPELPPLAAADNAFVVHFVAPDNPIGRPVTFEVKLDGTEGDWVSTGAIGSAAFNHLDQGRYVLRVRPRFSETIGHEATLSFTVLAPWYRTPFAYLAYVLSAIGIIVFSAWLSSLLSRRKNALLEQLVARRTGELNESNIRLANQVDEIQMLSQAITQSPVSVLITSPDGMIVFANPRVCDLTGYAATELIGNNATMLWAEEMPSSLIQELNSTVKQGESWHGQLVKRHKSGRILHVRTTISPIRNPHKQIRLHLVLEEDITDWLAEQERRQKLEAQLTQSQKLESLGTLAGGIAHDFNNILTGILGYCELARLTAPPEPELQDQLTQIRTAGLRAKDLVAQILTFSRRNITRLVPLDLARPVEEAMKLIRASTPATIEIKALLESGTVNADSTQIQQVVLNLCTNAVHAMADQAGILSVTVQRVAVDSRLAAEVDGLAAGPSMRLSVTDTGHGMSTATLARIFDPFFTTKRQGEGTGLGLSIVQGVMASHHGALRVLSTPGSGTTFELYFPVSTELVTPRVETNHAPRGDQQEILLVDDEPAVVEFAATRLRQLGYRVTPFSDPRLALLAIRKDPAQFHAIVTDLTMPHLTGVQLIQEARLVTPGIPAVIITGYGHAAGGAQFDIPSRCRMLNKPFSGEDLAHLLNEILQAKNAR